MTNKPISEEKKLELPIEVMGRLYYRIFKRQYDDIQDYTNCLGKLSGYGVNYEDIDQAISNIIEKTIVLQSEILIEINKVLQKRKMEIES